MARPVVVLDLLKLENLNSGLGQFCFHLAKNLAETNQQRFDLIFLVPPPFKGVFGSQVQYFFPGEKSSKPDNISILHLPHQESKIKWEAKKTIITIHDLNFVYKYGFIKKMLRLFKLKAQVNRASALAFISNFSRQDFFRHLDFVSQKTKVIYNGLCLPEKAEIPQTEVPRKPFFFSLGIMAEKKNFHVLIPLMKHFPEMDLVIAGNKSSPYAQSIIKTTHDLSLENRIFFPGEISEPVKSWYFEHCTAFLFPSKSEGFGLPLIEAFYFRKPVFCSNLTSLPEIGGPHAYYWNSFDEQEMAATIHVGLKDWNKEKAEPAHLLSLGFSWKKAAEAYLKLYEEVLHQDEPKMAESLSK